ncbi:hypothetical protein FXO38_32030 [Capsicum annuum]|nr:uncharacterized protein LOC107859679 [Capsicum annuum]KAF3621016.1 hypothetical protein FXO38_32030 [Capsicum annuum]KAF3625182.1 hypothetical protein FXO37_31004 [Capsicum annuum]
MMKELFQKRLSAFYNNWIFNKKDLWGNSDVVVIHTQQQEKDYLWGYSVSSQFYLWLIGEQLDDTTTIFTSSAIYFLCSRKNYSKIRSLCCSATVVNKIPVSVQLKANNDDGLVLIDATIRNERAIRNKKLFAHRFDDDGSCPFVLGYVLGEFPRSKLFWNCFNELETGRFKAIDVRCGVSKIMCTVDKPVFGVDKAISVADMPVFGVGVSGKEVAPKHVYRPPVNASKEKGVLKGKGEGSLWGGHVDQLFMEAMENRSVLLEKEESIPELTFEPMELRKKGSDLGSQYELKRFLWGDKGKGGLSRVNENPVSTTKMTENVSALMGDLNLSCSPSSGKQDKLRLANIGGGQQFKFGGNRLDVGKEENSKAGNRNVDQVFKSGASTLDAKEGKLEEIKENDDAVFKFGSSKLDGKDSRSKEVNRDGDQLVKLGEGKKDGDQLFKMGEVKKDGDQQFKIGGKRGRSLQPQMMEEKKGAKDLKLLAERLTAFYSSWRTYKEEQWGKADVLVITTQSKGPLESLSHPVSSSFLVWLLGDEFPETTAVFTDTGIEFLCTKDSFFRLRAIGIRMTMVAKVTVSVQLKKRGELCSDWLRKTLCQVNAAPRSGVNCPLVVGCISWESTEIGVLSHSKMFEVAYVDQSLINLFEQGSFEFAAQHSTLPKQFQMLSLETSTGAKTASALSLSEVAKMKSMDDNSYVSHTPEEEKLLEKKGDTSSSLPTDATVDNAGQVERSKLADKMLLLDIKEEGDMDTSITEDGAEEKLQVKECGEQSTPTTEGGMDHSIQPTDVTDAASENSLPDDKNGRPGKKSAGSDHEDDDWTLIEMECEGQEAEVAERVSWKRWFMDKTVKSFGLKDEVSDEAPSKRTKA